MTDQWEYLASIKTTSPEVIQRIANEAIRQDMCSACQEILTKMGTIKLHGTGPVTENTEKENRW